MNTALALDSVRTQYRRDGFVCGAVLGLLVLFPIAAQALGQDFYVGVASRIFAYGLAAVSLNLVLGYGGMLSFAQGALLGTGAYTVGILAVEAQRDVTFLPGTQLAWIAWPAAVLVSAGLAALIGAISLRTREIYFLMITLAFNQMIYYVFFSMKAYGGDDGLNLGQRSVLLPGLSLQDDLTFYYVSLSVLSVCMLVFYRLIGSRFGRVMRGIRENETRMQAIGYDTYRYKLACFVIGGAGSGLAGCLLANQNTFVSPGLLDWFQSGLLLVMVILGGVGRFWGGLLGAAAYLLVEEALSAYTQRWQIALGVTLILVTLYAPRGLAGLATQFRR